MLTLSPNPLLCPAPPPRTVRSVERELLKRPHLPADRRFVRRDVKADFRDARQAQSAADAIGQLPGETESVHLVISGRFALWDMVPAALQLAGARIEDLDIATLGFSRRNIAKLCALLDDGRIGHAKLLCSHYFAGTSPTIYDFAAEELGKRPQAEFLSVRTHAKIVLAAFADGRRLTIESSANLRSCKNIEQAVLIGSAGLYDFHSAWIDALFLAARKEPRAAPKNDGRSR